MAGRFVGRWKDRTASRRLCRPYQILFFAVALIGVASVSILLANPSAFQFIDSAFPSGLSLALSLFDSIALPRSLGELSAIHAQMGATLFQATRLSETLLAIGGVTAIAITLTHIDASSVDDVFSPLQLAIRSFVVFFALIFRPANFSSQSHTSNYIDGSGFFLIREGIIVAAGYYHAALILVDAFGRMSRRRLGLPSIQASTDSVPQNDTERR